MMGNAQDQMREALTALLVHGFQHGPIEERIEAAVDAMTEIARAAVEEHRSDYEHTSRPRY